ncbi:MAG TPA: hypothetical protein VFU41_01355 [Gemmatimonadales bacterium]|nr:hypothetical protein [Gemmatimonadales bacterium]
MERTNRWMVVVPIIAGLQLAACHTSSSKPVKTKPAHVEHVEGSEVSRVTLTAKAAERLDIKTALVREAQMARSGSTASVRAAQMSQSGARRKVVPYAAVLYDSKGVTWVYTSPEPLVFLRHRIQVDYIDGDQAILSEGPPVGTQVVTVGGQELFGAEFEIGH